MRLHIFGLWLCCLAYAVMVSAQPLPERRPLTGRITQPDGKPVSGAVITLTREVQQGGFSFWGGQAVTDANGFFSFPEADEDSYYIAVEAPGFDALQQKHVVLDSALAPLSIVLQRLVDARLRFLKADGTPLAKSQVTFRLERQNSQSLPTLRKTTDASGEYNHKEQRPGRYRLRAVSPGVGYAILDDLDLAYSASPTPIEVRLQRGGTLRLTALGISPANQEAQPLGGALLSLTPTQENSAADRAAGRIVRPEDANLQGFYAWSPDGAGLATRDGDGVLELSDLPPGRYTARLLLPGLSPSAWQDVEVKLGDTSSLDFRFPLKRAFTSLEVLLRDEKGQPVPSAEWNLQLRLMRAPTASDELPLPVDALPPLPVGAPPPLPVGDPLLPNEGQGDERQQGLIPSVSIRRARSDENGRFVLFPLQPGRWRVLLSAPRDLQSGRGRGATDQKDVQVPPTGGSVSFTVNPPK